MNIHNLAEVGEGDTAAQNFTRDRLGKKHLLVSQEDRAKVEGHTRSTIVTILALLFVSAASCAFADSAPTRRNTDIQISSSDLPPFSLNDGKKPEKDDSRGFFYEDESRAIGFDDDANPTVTNRF